MSETKLEAKQWGHNENSLSWRKFAMIAKFAHSENFARFAKFLLYIIAKFLFFFEKHNKIIN